MITDENYRLFPAVSNSDLTWLDKYWMPTNKVIELDTAYAMGSLLDAIITEPDKVNYYKMQVKGVNYQFTQDQFTIAKEMMKVFYKDQFCASMIKQCQFQKISYCPDFKIDYNGIQFTLPAKCKWDLFHPTIDLGGDIKTTACTTQKQVEDAVRYFDYDRSRAWYMDLEQRSNDILIFISKVNFKLFKVPIKRDSELYRQGKTKYQDLAFKWLTYFGNVNTIIK